MSLVEQQIFVVLKLNVIELLVSNISQIIVRMSGFPSFSPPALIKFVPGSTTDNDHGEAVCLSMWV